MHANKQQGIKKSYSRPNLTIYGSITHLTQGSSRPGSVLDGTFGQNKSIA
ncbi:MAG: hypothetical protein SFW36_14385 [Leptolyngbyaceae cyanobacterium bins.59]|nr:hypothetical protein [Leptolyngbyaceae cyanobacterium bins.59]